MTKRNLKQSFAALDAVPEVLNMLIGLKAYRVTKYISPILTVKATRRSARFTAPRKGSDADVVLCIGRPNHAECKFIKDAVKAKEPFPIKRVQIKLPRSHK